MGSISGFKIIESQIPLPLGEHQFLPSLPRPPVCSSLIITVPFSSPKDASSLALVLVESIESKCINFLPMNFVFKYSFISLKVSISGEHINLYPFLDTDSIS